MRHRVIFMVLLVSFFIFIFFSFIFFLGGIHKKWLIVIFTSFVIKKFLYEKILSLVHTILKNSRARVLGISTIHVLLFHGIWHILWNASAIIGKTEMTGAERK